MISFYLRKIILSMFFLFIVYISTHGQTQTVGTFINDNNSYNGYTLFNPIGQTTTYLIDNCGNLVHSWNSSYSPKLSVYLLENGNLLRTCNMDYPQFGGRLEILNWDSQVVWEYEFNSENYYLHHDIEPLPNGNILAISYDVFTPIEAIEAGRNPANVMDKFYAEKIIEIKPIGSDSMEIVWEWKAWDHLIQDYDPLAQNYGVVAEQPGLLNINFSASNGPNAKTDWIHFNSVTYNEVLDQIMVSSRNLSEIYIIDHSTTIAESTGHSGGIYGKGGDILYRFGNPAAYDRGSSLDRTLFFQHDPRWIMDETFEKYKISVFNNQVSSTTSSVNVFTPLIDSLGFYSDPGTQAFEPYSFEWTFESVGIHSSKISGAQRLPNGNTLICAGVIGTFCEVDTDGNIVWKYVNPVGGDGPVNQGEVPIQNRVFKINRYADNFSGFTNHTLIPGDPIELNPLPSDCQITEDTLATMEITVILEGAHNSSGMSTKLLEKNLLPKKQPFYTSPWNYSGTETVKSFPNATIVDWVLIDIRDAEDPSYATASKSVSRRAAFLLSNGFVVDIDGSSNLVFNNSFKENLYITIFHRNHLGVLSALPFSNDGDFLSYNFSNSQNAVYGGNNGHSKIENNLWGMTSGDINSDNSINPTDIESFWKPNAGEKGYLGSDLNLDGNSNNEDKNENWLPNLNKSSQIPEDAYYDPN